MGRRGPLPKQGPSRKDLLVLGAIGDRGIKSSQLWRERRAQRRTHRREFWGRGGLA